MLALQKCAGTAGTADFNVLRVPVKMLTSICRNSDGLLLLIENTVSWGGDGWGEKEGEDNLIVNMQLLAGKSNTRGFKQLPSRRLII